MTKLKILCRKREIDLAEAVELATAGDEYPGMGDLERMKAKASAQDAMISRMLMVQFGRYEDHFTDPEFEPNTDAEKLSFILGSHTIVVE